MASAIQLSPLAGEHNDWLSHGRRTQSTRMVAESFVHRREIRANEPLSLDDGMILYTHQDLPELGCTGQCGPQRSIRLAGVFQFKCPYQPDQYLCPSLQILRVSSGQKQAMLMPCRWRITSKIWTGMPTPLTKSIPLVGFT